MKSDNNLIIYFYDKYKKYCYENDGKYFNKF